MGVSARVLGEKFGLTAQEMNRVLVKFGVLEGTPGNYCLTELGKKYATVKDYHRIALSTAIRIDRADSYNSKERR